MDEEKQKMQLTIEYLEPLGIVKAIICGELNKFNQNMMVERVLAACEQHQTKRVFLDEREVDLKMSLLDIYDLPTQNELLGVPKDLRVAILYPANFNVHKLYRFYDDRAYIHGIKHKVFPDENAALQWLVQA